MALPKTGIHFHPYVCTLYAMYFPIKDRDIF